MTTTRTPTLTLAHAWSGDFPTVWDTINAGRRWEGDAELLLLACNDAAHVAILDWLTSQVDWMPTSTTGLILVGTRQWAQRRRVPLLKVPDLAIVDTAADDRLVGIVELKLGASVNGRHGYCVREECARHLPGAYANQLDLYAQGDCWTTTSGDDEPRGGVLLTRSETGPVRGWVTDVDARDERYDLAEAYVAQQKALEWFWTRSSWTSLSKHLIGSSNSTVREIGEVLGHLAYGR